MKCYKRRRVGKEHEAQALRRLGVHKRLDLTPPRTKGRLKDLWRTQDVTALIRSLINAEPTPLVSRGEGHFLTNVAHVSWINVADGFTGLVADRDTRNVITK